MVGEYSTISQRRFQCLPVSLGVVAKRDVNHFTSKCVGVAREALIGRSERSNGYLDKVAGLAIKQLLPGQQAWRPVGEGDQTAFFHNAFCISHQDKAAGVR